MFWLEPVMNLISMLFHVWLVVVSHWIRSGEPSLVLAGVRGETAEAEADTDELAWRSTRLGLARTNEALERATRAAEKNFMLMMVVQVEVAGCIVNAEARRVRSNCDGGQEGAAEEI